MRCRVKNQLNRCHSNPKPHNQKPLIFPQAGRKPAIQTIRTRLISLAGKIHLASSPILYLFLALAQEKKGPRWAGEDSTRPVASLPRSPGGEGNTASGIAASVSGGGNNTASTTGASVSGGEFNTASGGARSSVCGGAFNRASGFSSSVCGGENNIASGEFSSVSGGLQRTAPGENNWAAGPLFADN